MDPKKDPLPSSPAPVRKPLGGPLGAKRIGFQAGWAKCEKRPGVYDWAWLDEPFTSPPPLAEPVQGVLTFS